MPQEQEHEGTFAEGQAREAPPRGAARRLRGRRGARRARARVRFRRGSGRDRAAPRARGARRLRRRPGAARALIGRGAERRRRRSAPGNAQAVVAAASAATSSAAMSSSLSIQSKVRGSRPSSEAVLPVPLAASAESLAVLAPVGPQVRRPHPADREPGRVRRAERRRPRRRSAGSPARRARPPGTASAARCAPCRRRP